jgi:hypothetical protein
MHCCHFKTRCTYQYGSTEGFVLYIRVISHTELNKLNLNTSALNAKPTCISRYQIFINMTETAAVLTEGLGEIVGFKCHGQGSHVLLSFKFSDKYIDCSLISLMHAICPDLFMHLTKSTLRNPTSPPPPQKKRNNLYHRTKRFPTQIITNTSKQRNKQTQAM